jgi:predicted glycosyltransferase
MEQSNKIKNYLFFFVHPSKFHVFKNTINTLKSNGHHVEIAITSKDVLEQLLINEGWEYTNIFPEGRKMKNVSPIVSSFINLFRTIYRLWKFTKNKKFDLFITDDLLVYIGKLRRVKSIVFLDDDIQVVKPFSIILRAADYCLAPNITNLGKFESKRIGFDGYKELAYLHPNHFKPNETIIRKYSEGNSKYFILRLVSLRAYHDVGVSGIDSKKSIELVKLLSEYGRVYISAERELIPELEKYRIIIEPENLIHVLSNAYLYIGDSQTMSSEASILGVPSFRISDFNGKISVMEEKVELKLSKSYKSSDFSLLLNDVKDCLEKETEFIQEIKHKQQKMLSQKIDLSNFMIWLFENSPISFDICKKDKNYASKFK